MAEAAWEGTVIGGETAKKVNRVLDVRQGELCWVAGTAYMDMPLKPNILDDVSKDVSPPRIQLGARNLVGSTNRTRCSAGSQLRLP